MPKSNCGLSTSCASGSALIPPSKRPELAKLRSVESLSAGKVIAQSMKLIRTIIGLDKPAGKFGAYFTRSLSSSFFARLPPLLTWPYVDQLRNSVADTGDPYLVSWILWWDYHQTFTDPLNLFHANLFYPLRYTLGFSEHSYGIACLFFPLFALGSSSSDSPRHGHVLRLRAVRLRRVSTRAHFTGSYGVAWVAGIIFAFVPFRFHLLSHLLYLFSPWIPLLFEALVLFVRERSQKRAAWLGLAIFMSGITSISLFTLSLVPFAFAELFY